MTKEDFIKTINLLVDKRVKKILQDLPNLIQTEIENYMEKGISPTPSDVDSEISRLISEPSFKNSIIKDDRSAKIKTEEKKWSDNKALNSILNDMQKTHVPTKNASDMGSYQQLLESQYDDIDTEFTFNTTNMNDLMNRSVPTTPVAASSKAVLANELAKDGATPTIVNAMVKDYRKLLGKVDSIAKNTRKS